jgi:pimeloyl-ACP methyl ester carboxylesterase
MLTPDFTGSFDERMAQLYPILDNQAGWSIIGSSFGGLMGSVFTLDHPAQVRKLILLAPALILPPFSSRSEGKPVSVPTVIIHGKQDDVVPPEPVRELAQKAFSNLTYHLVNDNHRLHKVMNELNWESLLE